MQMPDSDEALVAMLADLGVKLPLRVSAEEYGLIVDAEGRDILQVTEEMTEDDARADDVAELIAAAINVAAGM